MLKELNQVKNTVLIVFALIGLSLIAKAESTGEVAQLAEVLSLYPRSAKCELSSKLESSDHLVLSLERLNRIHPLIVDIRLNDTINIQKNWFSGTYNVQTKSQIKNAGSDPQVVIDITLSSDRTLLLSLRYRYFDHCSGSGTYCSTLRLRDEIKCE